MVLVDAVFLLGHLVGSAHSGAAFVFVLKRTVHSESLEYSMSFTRRGSRPAMATVRIIGAPRTVHRMVPARLDGYLEKSIAGTDGVELDLREEVIYFGCELCVTTP